MILMKRIENMVLPTGENVIFIESVYLYIQPMMVLYIYIYIYVHIYEYLSIYIYINKYASVFATTRCDQTQY